MSKVFDQQDLEFIERIGSTRTADLWIKLFEKLTDHLNDSRTIPISESEPDYEKALGRALLARRLAARVIEEEFVDLLKQARNVNIRKKSEDKPSSYR